MGPDILGTVPSAINMSAGTGSLKEYDFNFCLSVKDYSASCYSVVFSAALGCS